MRAVLAGVKAAMIASEVPVATAQFGCTPGVAWELVSVRPSVVTMGMIVSRRGSLTKHYCADRQMSRFLPTLEHVINLAKLARALLADGDHAIVEPINKLALFGRSDRRVLIDIVDDLRL